MLASKVTDDISSDNYDINHKLVYMTINKPLVMKQPEAGQFIKELRLLIGLTQEQFAAKLGVTYPTINRWENSKSTPSPLAIQRLLFLLEQIGDRANHLAIKYLLISPEDN